MKKLSAEERLLKVCPMHELPATQSILEIALRHAEKANATRITQLHIVIGELSSMIDDSVQFYWDIISKDTIAEGATLYFQRIRAQLECKICGEQFSIHQEGFICPSCNSPEVQVRYGEEFFLDSIEIENGEGVCV
ncbi:MAG: hydrogenase maturation nickel metallochaperone HypA [Anaerolineae bacterium]